MPTSGIPGRRWRAMTTSTLGVSGCAVMIGPTGPARHGAWSLSNQPPPPLPAQPPAVQKAAGLGKTGWVTGPTTPSTPSSIPTSSGSRWRGSKSIERVVVEDPVVEQASRLYFAFLLGRGGGGHNKPNRLRGHFRGLQVQANGLGRQRLRGRRYEPLSRCARNHDSGRTRAKPAPPLPRPPSRRRDRPGRPPPPADGSHFHRPPGGLYVEGSCPPTATAAGPGHHELVADLRDVIHVRVQLPTGRPPSEPPSFLVFPGDGKGFTLVKLFPKSPVQSYNYTPIFLIPPLYKLRASSLNREIGGLGGS